MHGAARHLRDQAVLGQINACITPQVLCEFYAVMTNPRRVNRPLSHEHAGREVAVYLQAEPLGLIIPGHAAVQRLWALARKYGITGLRIHDLFLVATMLEHDVETIYTENVSDFQSFTEIKTVNPLVTASSSRM